jgi:hypothetical protein
MVGGGTVPCGTGLTSGDLVMNHLASGAAAAIAAAMIGSHALAGLPPLTLGRMLDVGVSITGSSRTFSYDGSWFDRERDLIEHSVDPVGRIPGGYLNAASAGKHDLLEFGWLSQYGAKYAAGSGTLTVRLLVAARVAEVLEHSSDVGFFDGGRELTVGTELMPGVHKIAWSLAGTGPSQSYGGGLRLEAAIATVPLPGAAPAAGFLLAIGLGRRRRRA